MSDYRPVKPKNPEDDWKIWLVLDPGKWLVPIWITLLVLVIIIHGYVLGSAKYAAFLG